MYGVDYPPLYMISFISVIVALFISFTLPSGLTFLSFLLFFSCLFFWKKTNLSNQYIAKSILVYDNLEEEDEVNSNVNPNLKTKISILFVSFIFFFFFKKKKESNSDKKKKRKMERKLYSLVTQINKQLFGQFGGL